MDEWLPKLAVFIFVMAIAGYAFAARDRRRKGR